LPRWKSTTGIRHQQTAGRTEFQVINPKLSKPILNEIDTALAGTPVSRRRSWIAAGALERDRIHSFAASELVLERSAGTGFELRHATPKAFGASYRLVRNAGEEE